MPRERRIISFLNTEIIGALKDFARTTKRDFPQSVTLRATVNAKSDRPVVLTDVSGKTLTSFYESEVAAALLLACKTQGIPVPRRAKKKLHIDGEEVGLMMEIERTKRVDTAAA